MRCDILLLFFSFVYFDYLLPSYLFILYILNIFFFFLNREADADAFFSF